MKKLGIKITAFLMLLTLTLPQQVAASRLLIPGGQVIGMTLEDDSVSVAGFDETLGAAAKTAGLQVGDQIVKIGKKQICCPQDVRAALKESDGTVVLTVRRGKSERQVKFCPAATEDGPKLGVFLKQGVTGIGTVTWYDPQSGAFGAGFVCAFGTDESAGQGADGKEGAGFACHHGDHFFAGELIEGIGSEEQAIFRVDHFAADEAKLCEAFCKNKTDFCFFDI